jgi:hypothetical protein
MSIRNTPIRCTGCDFESVLVHRPISLVYQLPNGEEFTTGRRFGWCCSCDGIRSIEQDHLGYFESKERVAELTRKVNSVKFIASEFFYKLLGSSRSKDEDELQELKMRLKIANARSSPPRCLSCGANGTGNILSLSEYVHVCGGHLKFEHSYSYQNPLRFNYKPEKIHLDCEGRKLRIPAKLD